MLICNVAVAIVAVVALSNTSESEVLDLQVRLQEVQKEQYIQNIKLERVEKHLAKMQKTYKLFEDTLTKPN